MQVTEIFRSIQGEGTRAGLPCIFIRLTGCNLRCTWCDTAYSFYGGEKKSLEEILRRVNQLAQPSPTAPKIRLAEITGGEPLFQPDTPELAKMLLREGFTVMIETSGERFIGSLPREVIKIIDVKCPDSGEPDTFDMANLAELGANDEVKFVIASRRDYEFALQFTSQHALTDRVKQVIFQPVAADPAGKWPALEPRELAEWILADAAPVRMGLQLHKFIWDPAMRGV